MKRQMWIQSHFPPSKSINNPISPVIAYVAEIDPYAVGVGVHGPKGTKPAEKDKKKEDFEAINMGLDNSYQIQAVRNYLIANGNMTIQPVCTKPTFIARNHMFCRTKLMYNVRNPFLYTCRLLALVIVCPLPLWPLLVGLTFRTRTLQGAWRTENFTLCPTSGDKWQCTCAGRKQENRNQQNAECYGRNCPVFVFQFQACQHSSGPSAGRYSWTLWKSRPKVPSPATAATLLQRICGIRGHGRYETIPFCTKPWFLPHETKA